MDFTRRVANFLFGMECLGCGSSSERLDPWLCPACRDSLVNGGKEPKFPGGDVLSLYPMVPLTRRLVHALKYGSIPGVASYMVRQLCQSGSNETSNKSVNVAGALDFIGFACLI